MNNQFLCYTDLSNTEISLACNKNKEIGKPAHVWDLADNKDTDQHVHLHTMIWIFVVCYNK